MCGIAGFHRLGDAPVPHADRLARHLLAALEERGRDASGFMALLDDGKVQLDKGLAPASRRATSMGRVRKDARTVLLHSRFATVGSPKDPRNAHPVISGRTVAIHNGTIWNADDLFREHGLPRIGTVDSEIVPAMLDAYGWDTAPEAFEGMLGGAALAIASVDRPQSLILARLRDYPLVYARPRGFVVWASTERILRRAWRIAMRSELRANVKTVQDYTMLEFEDGKLLRPKMLQRPIPPKPVSRRSVSAPTGYKRTKTSKWVPAPSLVEAHDDVRWEDDMLVGGGGYPLTDPDVDWGMCDSCHDVRSIRLHSTGDYLCNDCLCDVEDGVLEWR